MSNITPTEPTPRRDEAARRKGDAEDEQKAKNNPVLADLLWLQQTRAVRLAEMRDQG
ncbi:hypothetical protein ACF08M_01510 [Streptomyces sp. NPDC015032]|uniref:hypothetical protein n=1 Tax=Streptomyces sp. NPDC015032 TaxID=3364937 RepID=UPI00370081D7